MVLDNQEKLNRSRIGEGIYLLYFALMVGARAAGLYDGMMVYNVILVIGMGLFAVKMVVTKHTVKEYAMVLVLLGLSGIVYLHTGEKGLLVCFTMMLGMKEVSVRKAIKTGVIVAGVIILGKICLGVFGILPEIYYPQERAGAGMMFRHALGYAHPNTLHMNVLMLSMMVMYLVTRELQTGKRDEGEVSKDSSEKTAANPVAALKRNAIVMLAAISGLVFLFNLYIFQYSGSRTGLLACIAFLIVNFWLFVRKNIGIFEKVVSNGAFPIVGFIAIVLPLVLKGEIFDFVNRTIFTTRFSIARYFWQHNSVSLFGIRLNNPDPDMATYGIDMAQLYLFLQLGLVAFAVIALLTTWYVYMAIKLDARAELAVLMGMLFLGIWEPLLYNLGFKNFTFVFMGAFLYGVTTGDYGYLEWSHGALSDDSTCGVLGIEVKRLLKLFSLALIVGIAASMIYLAATSVPTALYGDRQEGESGNKFGMEELYLSADQVAALEASGDIVVGYVDETIPMYQYDAEIASMEYNKRVISVGVWSMMLVAAIGLLLEKVKSKNR